MNTPEPIISTFFTGEESAEENRTAVYKFNKAKQNLVKLINQVDTLKETDNVPFDLIAMIANFISLINAVTDTNNKTANSIETDLKQIELVQSFTDEQISKNQKRISDFLNLF